MSAISTGHSLESIFQSTVLPGGIFDTPTPLRASGKAAGPEGTSPEAAVPGPAGRLQEPHLLPHRSGSLGHEKGHDFGGLAQQITSDLREGGALWHHARNPCSKQKVVFWRGAVKPSFHMLLISLRSNPKALDGNQDPWFLLQLH